ncbi:M23 family metallopeptidase [Streptomyces sp. BR123]|uniref:M23 family metallopeptidase n=1 Tax=Streptomyces sp. BR123 TaxID=2749828 RepID=UPI00211B6957|nr:M23 family metallopeptidase [Streptomyces sp. BR123]
MPAREGVENQEPPSAGAWGEWNPTEDSVRPIRGKHRNAKGGGGLARSSTVLGVGIIAAVGAGGIATAQNRPQVPISIPSLPGLSDDDSGKDSRRAEADGRGAKAASGAQSQGQADAGEILRTRILQQAEAQQEAVDVQTRVQAEQAAREAAAAEAKTKREEAEKAAEEARLAAEQQAKEAAEKAAKEAAEAKAEQEQAAKAAAGSYSLPTSSYTITSHYGVAGSMWSSGYHTGLDFAAPTGTPVKAVAAGKIISAGWSGAYGYRIVLQLADGTEVWYCHLSSMSVTSGEVGAGDTIGRVGATGNVTGPHLHLEVRKGGSTVDPLSWLRSKGLTP